MAQTQRFTGRARRIAPNVETGTINYFYHDTAVVGVFNDGTIRLNSGGFRTYTTKLAMNQASNQDGLGFGVVQKAGKWLVWWKGETHYRQKRPTEVGQILSREEEVT